jgi:hypothetical protein
MCGLIAIIFPETMSLQLFSPEVYMTIDELLSAVWPWGEAHGYSTTIA